MTIDEALRELTGAKGNKLPWMRIAEILQAARKSQRAGRLSGEFMEEAGKASGYAPGLLRRLEAARQFLLDLDRDHPHLRASERLGDAAAMVFKVEQLKRLYGVDREKALSLFESAAAGEMSVRALEREYKVSLGAHDICSADPFGGQQGFGLATGIAKAPRRLFASAFDAACWEALQTDLSKLSGDGDLRLSRDYKFTYFTPYAVAVGMKLFGIDFIDGFRPVSPMATPNQAQINRILRDIVFEAPFFRRHWVILPPAAEITGLICTELATIEPSVGCAQLKNGCLTVIREASASLQVKKQALLAGHVLEAGVPPPKILGY